MKTCNISQQIIEPAAGNAACGIQIDSVKALHNIRVIGNRIVRHFGLTKALYLNIIAVIRAKRHGGIDDIGDHQHDLMDLRSQLIFLFLQLSQPVSVSLDLCLDLFGLFQLTGILLGHAHELTDLLRQRVACSTKLLCLRNGCTILSVQCNYLIHQRELLILKLLFNIFFYNVRIFPDKLNVKHVFPPRNLFAAQSLQRIHQLLKILLSVVFQLKNTLFLTGLNVYAPPQSFAEALFTLFIIVYP